MNDFFKQPNRILAVIGTAGRDKTQPMDEDLWYAMCDDLRERISPNDHLVSGGAAWADHLAVHAFDKGWVKQLTLFLPAPMGSAGFIGPQRSAANAANFYHRKFSAITRIRSYAQLREVVRAPGVTVYEEPIRPGYGAMFARNKKIARLADSVLAYTFGQGEAPADGGTLDTWQQINCADKAHVNLIQLAQEYRAKLYENEPEPERERFVFQ